MAIKYYLQPNPVTPDPNDQSARVVSNKSHDVDSITKLMLQRGSTITEADVKAVLNVFFAVVTDEVADGNNVKLPLVNIRPGVTGVFSSITDSFDASRHMKKASLSAGLLLEKKMLEAQTEKITKATVAPMPVEFFDVNTQTANSILTPGGIGQVIGSELKFNNENAAEGIFFIAGDGAATQAAILQNRTEGKLVFSIPALPPGGYTLEIRKGYGTTNLVVRTGSLQEQLQVS